MYIGKEGIALSCECVQWCSEQETQWYQVTVDFTLLQTCMVH